MCRPDIISTDIDQCPRCPDPVKAQCARHRECQTGIEMSSVCSCHNLPIRGWNSQKETNEKKEKCHFANAPGLELRYWLDLSPCVSRFALLKSPLSANWLIRILNASLWAEQSHQSHQLTTSHIQYFTSHRGGPGRRRMDSIKFYCPILPAP